jgi:radical SAM protein with 4Fe4S-binding SPASM domain
MFFRLNPECYYVKGEHSGAIYDLIEGSVYSLDTNENELILNCEKNGNVSTTDTRLIEMKKKCLGNFYDKRIFVEKLRVGTPLQDALQGKPPSLTSVLLEINNSCNESCWYCGSKGVHRSSGCLGCNTWPEEKGTPLMPEEWKIIIDGLADLNCQSLFFTGGDLTLAWGLTRELLDYAQQKFPQICVIVNSKRFTSTFAEDLKGKAFPIIQTDDITKINADDRYLLIVNENENSDTQSLSSKMVQIDSVSRDFSQIPRDSCLISKTKIQKTDIFRFSHTRKEHPCLGNTLTVSWKGDVLPCPLLRKYSLGSMKDMQLYEIFMKNAEGIKKFWNMSLENIPKCKMCEFKYACNDCRALEEALTGDLYGKKLCRYDVRQGVWV